MKRAQASLLSALLALAPSLAGQAWAQFEEPDTLGRLAAGPFIELNFRGVRGERGTDDISFGGGPSFGVRVEYRASGRLSLAALGSFARLEERRESDVSRVISPDKFTLLQFGGELLLRVKPDIPGYFVVGGGIRRVDPDSDTGDQQVTQIETFTEPLGILGAGIEVAAKRHRAFRVDLRSYLVSPNDDPNYGEVKSVEVDFAVGVGFLYKF